MALTVSGSGACPRRGSRVDLAAPKPAFRMNRATSRPIQPSNGRPEKWETARPTRTAPVATASERESTDVARRASEEMRLPRAPWNQPIHSLTRMEAARMPAVSGVSKVSSGWRIFSKELWPSSTPTSRISRETIRPARYSALPWPKGWSASAFCPANRKPTRVTTEEAASERLLKASAVTEMAPEISPAASLPANRSRLRAMPMAPDTTP